MVISDISDMLLESFVLFVFAGSLFSLALGAGLIFRSDAMLKFFALMNRWVSTRMVLKSVEMPRAMPRPSTEDKRHWLIGLGFLLGGAYAGYILATSIDVAKVVWSFGIFGPRATVATMLVDALRWCLVAGCLAAVVLGVILIAFPKAWAAIEKRANYWYSTRQLAMGGDTMRIGLDDWVARFPRAAGAIILALSMIPALAAGILLFTRPLGG